MQRTEAALSGGADCAPGALLGGKYRLERLLGEGGMANVWLARNEFLDLPVALKIVRPEIRGSETAARLLTEARVQANLRHPNVARVYDYGQTESGDAFIVMELLEGYSMADWLEREGPLDPVLAVQVMLPVIDALCAAHRAGVVHRDLKPDNIFISHPTTDLCPKLLDFGIAKCSSDCNPRLTGQGGVIGSPAYMAPEQARGLPDCDERVDVWAACVVLYEAITGKPAFDGSNYLALMLAVIEEELEPLTLPGCEELWPILAGGLNKEREQRTPTMLTLGAQLAKWLETRGAPQDLGGEPVHWRYAFSEPSIIVAPQLPRPRATSARSSRAGVERRQSFNRRVSDRRGSTPLSAVRSFRTRTMSPSEIRKAAAAKIALAACVGGALLGLGLTQGPWSWLTPHPGQAYALSDEQPVEAQASHIAQLATQPKPTPTHAGALPVAAPQLSAAMEPEAKPERPQQFLTQGVRRQPEFAQVSRPVVLPSAEHAQAKRAAPHTITLAQATKAAESPVVAVSKTPTRNMKLDINSFLDPQDASALKQPSVAMQPPVTPRAVVTVRPRPKAQPSEAELGLKNPW